MSRVACSGVMVGKRKVRRAIIRLTLALLVCEAAAATARAQDYPSRPIRLIVPFLAGGGVDVAARILGQKLSDAFGQQIIIENRAGAGGVVGANAAAKAASDGYTFLFGPGDFVTRPSLMSQMTFDPHKDLVPVAMVSSNPMLVVAGATAPFSNLNELIAVAKAQPQGISYATPGTATLNHVAGEWMAAEAGIKLVHVPYRSGGTAANGKIACYGHPFRLHRRHEIVEDLVDNRFIENALIAVGEEIEFQAFHFDAESSGRVSHRDRREIRLTRDRANAGELRENEFNLVIPLWTRIGEGVKNRSRLGDLPVCQDRFSPEMFGHHGPVL